MTEAVLSIGTTVTTVALAAGLLLWTQGEAGRATDLVIDAGLFILMAMPVTRLAVAIATEAKAREWRFVALGLATVALLGGSVMVAWLYRS